MTAVRKINWGILGCAGIAERAFIPAVLNPVTASSAAIASRDEARAADWARRFGFLRSHRTYQELVDDPAIDAVYNPLPNDLHAEWSIRALRAGKHVLCEKPMALNASEARAMIQAAEMNGVLLMEGFMYKFHPQIGKTLELIRAGAIGDPRSVHSSFTFRFERDGSNYRWSPAQGGGALYDVGCYTIEHRPARSRRRAALGFRRRPHRPGDGGGHDDGRPPRIPRRPLRPVRIELRNPLSEPAPRRRHGRHPPARAGLFGQGLRRRRRDRPRRSPWRPCPSGRPTCSP